MSVRSAFPKLLFYISWGSWGWGGTPILRVSMDMGPLHMVVFFLKFAPMMGAFWGIPAPIIPFLKILPSLGVQNDPIFAH